MLSTALTPVRHDESNDDDATRYDRQGNTCQTSWRDSILTHLVAHELLRMQSGIACAANLAHTIAQKTGG
jgi:hypothetical protein